MSGQGSYMVKLTLLFIVSMKETSCSIKPICSEPSRQWNLLHFAMFWPPSLCMFEHRCRRPISSNITGWIIHGLWPTENGSRVPCYCNNSWKFDVKQVQHLRPELDWKWPNTMLNERDDEKTWGREWNKHGTCATSLPDLHDEVHYFNFTLTLLQRFNLTEILARRGVLPGKNPYKTKDLAQYITEAVGAQTKIICIHKNTENFLEQVQICMNKTFSPVNCSRTTLSPQGQVHSDNSLRFFQEGNLISRQQHVTSSRLSNTPNGGCSSYIYYPPL